MLERGPSILLPHQRWARRRWRWRRRVGLPVGRGRRSDDGGRHGPRGGRGGHEVVQAQHGRHDPLRLLLNSPMPYPNLLPKVSSCWLKEQTRFLLEQKAGRLKIALTLVVAQALYFKAIVMNGLFEEWR